MGFELPANTRLHNGKYEIAKVLGQGGFGITYLAILSKLNKQVAVKEFFVHDKCSRGNNGEVIPDYKFIQPFKAYKNKFLNEGKVLAKLDHPNILKVTDYFEENESAYLVTDYVDGMTLRGLIDSGNDFILEDTIRISEEIVSALDYIHTKGLLHRDIKPSNIIIKKNGNVKLIDFGIAREYIEDKTKTHTVILTPGFAPPEQYEPRAKRGAYTDIYSLGATIYNWVTGIIPPTWQARVNGVDLEKPMLLNPEIGSDFEDALLKSLNLDPKERHQDVLSFLNHLKGANVSSAKPLFPFKKINKHGFINSNLNWKIEPKFDRVESFDNGVAKVYDYSIHSKCFGLINKEGKWIIEPNVYEMDFWSENLIRYKTGTGWGLVDLEGESVLSPQYDEIKHLNYNSSAIISKDQRYGVVDANGEIIIPLEFNRLDYLDNEDHIYWGRFEGKDCMVFPGRKKFYLDMNYRPGIQDGIVKYLNFHEDLIAFSGENGLGFLNKRGEVQIKPRFWNVSIFSEGLCPVVFSEKRWFKTILFWGLINEKGKLKVKRKLHVEFEHRYLMYDTPLHFVTQGRIFVFSYKVKKWALFDTKGNRLTPFEFDNYGSSDWGRVVKGLLAVGKEKKWGLINLDGKILTEIKYDRIDMHSLTKSKLIRGVIGDKFCLIDNHGKEITDVIFNISGSIFNGDFFWASTNLKKYGLFTREGKQHSEIIYSGKTRFTGRLGIFHYFLANDEGYLDRQGLVNIKAGHFITTPEYNNLNCFEGVILGSRKNGNGVLLNYSGKVIYEFDVEGYLVHFSEDDNRPLFWVEENNHTGVIAKFVTHEGKEITTIPNTIPLKS